LTKLQKKSGCPVAYPCVLVAVKNHAATQHTKSPSNNGIESLFRLRTEASKFSTVKREPDRLSRHNPGEGGRAATRV
jgi:hypothetical protein